MILPRENIEVFRAFMCVFGIRLTEAGKSSDGIICRAWTGDSLLVIRELPSHTEDMVEVFCSNVMKLEKWEKDWMIFLKEMGQRGKVEETRNDAGS